MTLRVGDYVTTHAGTGILRSIQIFDGGHALGVDVELTDPRGWIAGCPHRLGLRPHNPKEQ